MVMLKGKKNGRAGLGIKRVGAEAKLEVLWIGLLERVEPVFLWAGD
jgi:hypothetical protein